MITEKMVCRGIERSLITFERDPNASFGTVARIGDRIFYFDAEEAMKRDPKEYLEYAEKGQLVWEILKALNELEFEIPELYLYFRQKLEEGKEK